MTTYRKAELIIATAGKLPRGDLWIMSSNINFRKERRDDFVAIGVSDYHGPSADGVLEVAFLEGKPHNTSFKKVYALHGPCIQCELAMLNVLREMQPQSMPLLPLLLHCPKTSTENSPTIEAEKMADQFIIKYNLNEDQAKVVHIVAKWFANFNSSNPGLVLSKPEICLVHGIFGSGKSYLLTVIIIFLTSTYKDGKAMRILVSAATNVAIDRVLSGLLDLGFNDFIRVGSIKRIARNILPYSLCTASDVNDVEDATLKEMQERMKEASVHERLEIEEELKSLKEGKIAKLKEKLKDIQVVGVTCYSAINPILKGNKFQICILDECSQIPEPLSLLPLSQFGCTKLIAVGDPSQLPPALLGGSDLCEGIDAETAGDHRKYKKKFSFEEGENETNVSPSFHDLRRALFVRLVEVGYQQIMLRTQYRCHPRLITVPNELFYGGRIISGCREIDRPPLLSGMPPLLFWDTCMHGSEVKDSLKSYSNLNEAKMACELIRMMLEYGIRGYQIGVIVLYKSQANLVQELLSESCSFKRKKRNTLKVKPIKNLECQESKTYASTGCEDDSFKKHGYLGAEVQISTVDAFQGMEKNIIILSCCRTNGLGFLSSPNRLNVALTRARHHLIIIGKASNLNGSPFWRKLLSNAASTSGSYISTPESGSEIIVNSMREHIFGKNCNHTEHIDLLKPSDEDVDANKGPDSGQSQQMQGSHALHIVDIPGVDAGSTSCLYVENNKEITGIKMSELFVGNKDVANRCNYDNKIIYLGISQTEHEVWSGDALECTDMNEDVALLKEDQESLSKKVDPSKGGGDFEPGEAGISVLDCQSSSLVDTDLFSASDPPPNLLQSVPIAEFNLVDAETFSTRQQLEVKQTDKDNPNSGNVDVLLITTTVAASENGRNSFNGLQEAKDGRISDVDKDDLAPTFDLGI